ncbi:hypothetical protein [Burkholderia gladioli]|nr:hypothetical protein [Burkholderia gladioli]
MSPTLMRGAALDTPRIVRANPIEIALEEDGVLMCASLDTEADS